MLSFAALAGPVKSQRRTSDGDNPFVQAERRAADNIVALMDAWRDLRDNWYEAMFRMFFKQEKP